MLPYLKAFQHYKNGVSLLGFAILVWAASRGVSYADDSYKLAVFLLLVSVAEFLPITFSGTSSEIMMTMPAAVSLFLSQGAPATIVVVSISQFVIYVIRHGKKYGIGRRLFELAGYNMSIYALSIGVACLTYRLAGGKELIEHGDPLPILPLLLWVFACTTADALIVGTGAALYLREPWRMHAVQNLRWTIPNHLVTWPSAILFAYLYQQYGMPGIMLLIVPFLVGRQALNHDAMQRQMYLETVTTLGTYMQHYHPYTKGHLERVADLSDRIAKQMGLPVHSLTYIRDAGLLHDIGKVGVDESVLDKVGQLSDEDWAIIKQHPARGAEILSQMSYFEHIVHWVRGHHERPDGRGYPDGLNNGQIPVEAAVIAVADAFDAMTGGEERKDQRVYRTPLTLDQAMDQVRFGAGSQFDPRVVKAFMRVMAQEGRDAQ